MCIRDRSFSLRDRPTTRSTASVPRGRWQRAMDRSFEFRVSDAAIHEYAPHDRIVKNNSRAGHKTVDASAARNLQTPRSPVEIAFRFAGSPDTGERQRGAPPGGRPRKSSLPAAKYMI